MGHVRVGSREGLGLTKLRWFGRMPLVAVLLLVLGAHRRSAPSRARNPGESVRVNTPNDPDFDHCEPDDEQGATCTNVFDQQIERFGFAPNGSQLTALYHNPTDPHVQRLIGAEHAWPAATRWARCRASRPTARGSTRPAPRACRSRSSTRASAGTRALLRKKVALNRGELPLPARRRRHVRAVRLQLRRRLQRRRLCERPARVGPTDGHDDEPGADSFLDASDLIAAFSDGSTTTTGTATSTTSPAGTSSTTTTTPTTPPATRAPRTTAPDAPRRPAQETNEAAGGTGVCPDVPDRPDARVGHVRGRHQQLRAGGAVRGRQRHRGRRGRGRRAVQLALRAAGVRARLPAGRVLRDRLVGPEHGRPQHPDALRRGDAGAGHRRRRRTASARTRRSSSSTSSTTTASRSARTPRSGPGSATPARPSTAATRTS